MGTLTDLLVRAGLLIPNRRDLRLSAVAAIIAVGFAGFAIVGTYVWSKIEQVNVSVFTREPQVTLDGAYYTGTFSNVGALLWMGALTLTMVGWLSTDDPARRRMFLTGGLATLLLLVDDFFLIHDSLQRREGLGDADVYLQGSLFLVALAMVITQRQPLALVGTIGLLGSLGFFALSAALDILANDMSQIVEDGFKFIGICLWTATWLVALGPWELRRG